MGTKDLRARPNWQDISGGKAGVAEQNFYAIFMSYFKDTKFQIASKPRTFHNIYSQILLHETVLANIYNPAEETWIHGIIPDYAITNTETNKTIYVEVKRQDGWVEGKPRSAGRGNAHERSCKFFTPGLMGLLRQSGKLGDQVLPFWIVFQGDIARDPKRVREVTFWFGEYSNHFFMWSDATEGSSIIRHFDEYLRPLLL